MRKFYFLAMICLSVFALTNCGKKEESKNEEGKNNPIVGVWIYTEDGIENEQERECLSKTRFQFNENHHAIITIADFLSGKCTSETRNLTYEIKENVLTLRSTSNPNEVGSFTFIISNSGRLLTLTNGTRTFKMVKK